MKSLHHKSNTIHWFHGIFTKRALLRLADQKFRETVLSQMIMKDDDIVFTKFLLKVHFYVCWPKIPWNHSFTNNNESERWWYCFHEIFQIMSNLMFFSTINLMERVEYHPPLLLGLKHGTTSCYRGASTPSLCSTCFVSSWRLEFESLMLLQLQRKVKFSCDLAFTHEGRPPHISK